jgi:VIT1/CCC1 family predicted Fe2+/Mn2+ transporter
MFLEPQVLDDTDASPAAPEPNSDVFGDIPRWIWIAFLSAWALLFGLFLVFFTKDGEATFAVITAAFFALMTLGLPAALATQSKPRPHGSQRVIETRSGPLPLSAAATQILLIPIGAVVGLTAFIIVGM